MISVYKESSIHAMASIKFFYLIDYSFGIGNQTFVPTT